MSRSDLEVLAVLTLQGSMKDRGLGVSSANTLAQCRYTSFVTNNGATKVML